MVAADVSPALWPVSLEGIMLTSAWLSMATMQSCLQKFLPGPLQTDDVGVITFPFADDHLEVKAGVT